jgi:serine protease Do
VSSNPSNRLGLLFGVLVALGLVVAGVPNYVASSWAFAVEKGKIDATRGELAGVQEVANAFRMVARVTRPGVVQISVQVNEKDREESVRLNGREDELRDQIRHLERSDEQDMGKLGPLLREFGEVQAQLKRLETRLARGNGSGLIYDADGHILTNNHVVENRERIRVRLNDGREYDARTVGTDSKTDLAMIKIDAPDLQPLPFANSDEVEVGDWVLAVGAPFGLSQSVTHGIISAKGRTDVTLGRDIMYRDFLQTDAAINPGNSGGPLVSIQGQVVGVNTAIATEDGFNAGIAFVIPSNAARKVAEQLKKDGAVTRGWLGVSLRELNAADARLTGADRPAPMIDEIYQDAAAYRAGLLCEDVVMGVNDRPISSVAALREAVADIQPGQSAKLELLRDGKHIEVAVTPDKQPDNINEFRQTAHSIRGRRVEPLPLELRSLRPGWASSDVEEDRRAAAAKQTYGDADGVLIVGLADGASSYAFERFQLVVSVNEQPVKTIADVEKTLRGSAAKNILLQLIEQSGEKRTIEFLRKAQ